MTITELGAAIMEKTAERDRYDQGSAEWMAAQADVLKMLARYRAMSAKVCDPPSLS